MKRLLGCLAMLALFCFGAAVVACAQEPQRLPSEIRVPSIEPSEAATPIEPSGTGPSIGPSGQPGESGAPSRSSDFLPVPPPAESSVNSIDIATYRLGVGDQIIVNVYGAYNERTISAISPDGTLFVDNVGSIPIASLTLPQASRRIRSAVFRFFHNCDVSLQLQSVRHFNVYVLGDVVRPGVVEVRSTTTAGQAILLSGGVTRTGSQRAILLTNTRKARRGALRIDLIKWRYGLATVNPTLKPGDVITVPTIGPIVQVSGEVRRPGDYEILPGEDVAGVLRLAGGFTSVANERRVQLSRLRPSGERQGTVVSLVGAESPAWTERLQNGDEVQVFNRTIGKDTIVVTGELQGKDYFAETVNQLTGQREIERRALYQIREGEGVREVVLALGGPTVKADLEHAHVEREMPDGHVEVLTVNLRDLLSASSRATDVILHPGDVLNVPAREDSVYVIGEVLKPGPIPYNANFGLRQYLTLAGGMTDKAATQHGRIVRPPQQGKGMIIRNVDVREVIEGKVADNFQLRPGDIVLVPRFHPFYKDILEAINPFIFLTPYFTK